MTAVRIPPVLRQQAGNQKKVEVAGSTVGEALESLFEAYPGLREQIFTEDGSLNRFVNVYVNGRDVRYEQELATPVTEADEVILVDISPESLQDRLRAGKVYPGGQAERALLNFFRTENLSALRELALREVAEDVEARRGTAVLDPLSKRAVGERVLALVEPQPRSQRVLRRAWRSAQRLGAEIDALWMRRPGHRLNAEEASQLAALRRLASILGVHFLEEEGDDLVATVRRIASERGSTYIFVGTPDERRWVEVTRGSLLSRMVRELPGIDIRVVAHRALRDDLRP